MSEANLEAHPVTRSTPSLKCLAYDNLPPELWLKIFPELPRNDIQAITLTSSSFRLMAQPLLFSVFDVSPFFMEYHTSQPTLRPRWYLDRTVERLKCYRLKHIAPAVKHCWISPYSRKGFPPRNRRDYLEPALIIEAVMEALPSFPNLSMLTWHCLDMTPQWWSIIQRLPIQTFWFNSCTVFGPDPAPRPVKFLDLDQWAWEGKRTNHVSVYEDHIPGVSKSLLSLVLHPDHIRRITVPRLDTAETLLTAIADMEMLRCINTLCLPAMTLSSPNFIPALIKCPTLEEIRISALEEPRVIPTPGPIPPDALPSLSFYEGPYSLLMSFAAFRRLRGIKLWGIDEQSSYCNVTALLEILHHLSEINTTLEALDIAVTRITPGLLNHLSSFPALETANISSCDGPPRQEELPLVDEFEITYNSPVTLLFIYLRKLVLPPRLANLTITTRLNSSNLDPETQEKEAFNVIECIAEAHPALQHVTIVYGTYWHGICTVRWDRVPAELLGDPAGPQGRILFTESKRTLVYTDTDHQESDHNWSRAYPNSPMRPRRVFRWLGGLFRRFL